jgi:membrane fusion protein, copper/silver efflux system
MSKSNSRGGKILKFLWSQVSALVAVVLIIGALMLGYHIGTPAPEVDEVALNEDHGADEHGSGGQGSESVQMYTCSMHPTVRLPDPDAKCPICFMDLIPVREEDGGAMNQIRFSEAEALAEIETAKVGRFFPSAEVRLYGKVTYDETSVSRITAYFPGRLDRLFVNYIGVPVKKGDHLAEMYSPELLAAFEELRQAKIAANQNTTSSDLIRRMTLQTLQGAREKLRLYGLTEDQILLAEAGEASGEKLTVYSPITGIVTMLSAREGDYVVTGSPIAMVADLSRLWVDLEAYESQLPLLRWGQRVTFTVESHPGEVYEGLISFIEPIVDKRTRTAAVRIAVDNADGLLKPGMFASAVARPRVGVDGAIGSNAFAGRWVGPMHPTIIHDGPGVCEICGMVLVPAEELGADSQTDVTEPPLVIPRTAVLFTGVRSMVYVLVPDTELPTYESREVVLGPRAGDFYTVRSGVTEGETVVVKGSFRIDSSMQIAGKPSMMSPDGGGSVGHQHGGMGGGNASSGAMDMSSMFTARLSPIYEAYLKAQEALTQDDLSEFLGAAGELDQAVEGVDLIGLLGEPLGVWRQASTKFTQGEEIATIEMARQAFGKWSQGVIALQKEFGHVGGETWNVAHCPMAFDFDGADWMQRGDEIQNPYFGQEMPGCGSVTGTFTGVGGGEDE